MTKHSRWVCCCYCGEGIWLESQREEDLRRSGSSFYCLWGHSQAFLETPVENERDQLRRERDRLKQQAARLHDEIERERTNAAFANRCAAARGQVTKLKNRAAAGLCPCCNRSFTNLLRHMATKHEGYEIETKEGPKP